MKLQSIAEQRGHRLGSLFDALELNGTPIGYSTLHAYWTGRRIPGAARLSALADVLDCTTDELLGRAA